MIDVKVACGKMSEVMGRQMHAALVDDPKAGHVANAIERNKT